MSKDKILKPFGKYILLDVLARGGMAEVFRAKHADDTQNSRIIILKKTHPQFANDKSFLEMFKNEIRISMSLNHPNIAQVYDYGFVDSIPFITMEYVRGLNLQDLRKRVNELSKKLPIEIICLIIAQAAKALHYAHEFKDPVTNEEFKIVHRDISPQNILISEQGITKVIDFGIAKATTNSVQTQVGIVKGKPRYMSPEQVHNLPLDGRSDLFSLGIVFWEALTGKKLFGKDQKNEFLIMKEVEAIESRIYPPSQDNPDVPKVVDDIVLKCLRANRQFRFSNCEQFSFAIWQFLGSQNQILQTEKNLKIIIENLTKKESDSDKLHLQQLQSEIITLQKISKSTPSKSTTSNSLSSVLQTDSVLTSKDQEKNFKFKVAIASCLIVTLVLALYAFTKNKSSTIRNPAGHTQSQVTKKLIYQNVRAIYQSKPSLVYDLDAEKAKATYGNASSFPIFKNVFEFNSVLNFNGNNNFFEINELPEKLKPSRELTVFVVMSRNSDKTGYAISCHQIDKETDVFRVGFTERKQIRIMANEPGNYYDQKPLHSTSKLGVYTAVFGPYSRQIYQNSSPILNSTDSRLFSLSETAFCSIGQEWDGLTPSDFFHGEIGQIIIFSEVLDHKTREQIENYLMEKFNIPIPGQ